MLTRELLARLPKAELHVHLDSALRPETMIELAREAKFTLPTTEPNALRRFMLVDNASSLEDYLARFEHTIPLLQTPDHIERVAHEMVEDAARDGLRYLEVRYCPRLSTHGGLTMEEALDAELRGLARGERDFGVITRVINCSLRHYAPEVSVAIARLSVAYRDRGVVAFDLAGGEAGRPPGCTRRRSTWPPTAASASPSTRERRRARLPSRRRCIAATPTGSATAPACTRIRFSATIFATAGC
jgi:adenosine deaminase